MRYLIFVLLLSTAVFAQVPAIEPGVSQELAKWRAARYSNVRYKLNLTLEKMSPVLKGSMEIRVKVSPGTQAPSPASPQGGEMPPIILDWRRIRGSESLSTVSNVVVNGKPVLLSTNWPPTDSGGSDFNEHLVFRDGVKPGENVITLDFTSPILTSGSAITRYIDKEDGSEYIYSLFVPSDASTAFPVFDQPDLKAYFDLEVDVPKEWNVVSNNIKMFASPMIGYSAHDDYKRPPIPAGFFRHKFLPNSPPISTYVFAFASGEFAKFSQPGTMVTGVDLLRSPVPTLSDGKLKPASDIYVRKSQAAKFQPHAAEVFRLNREAVKYFEEYFDYKFPFPKYDLVLIPEFPFGGMEHAGATFLRESAIIFPQEPTKSDLISRATLIFHEAAHQWFGDTVTMKWFDDLWLKEGFANFMAYKAMERIMPDANAWKVFYERIKQPAYATDSTKGTTPIYQEIPNLSAAKSAYGNIVYNKAPSFLKQAEFYLGPDKFQTAVRAFLKKYEYKNAAWQDLVAEMHGSSGMDLKNWANRWINHPGVSRIVFTLKDRNELTALQKNPDNVGWPIKFLALTGYSAGKPEAQTLEFRSVFLPGPPDLSNVTGFAIVDTPTGIEWVMPNYRDYGYGIFLLDDKSREYVLKNVQNEKDAFLRSMMYGALWDSVREGELDPKEYVELAMISLPTESDETIIASVLGRVSTAMNYYFTDSRRASFAPRIESILISQIQNAKTQGQKITYYRAFLSVVSTDDGRWSLKQILQEKMNIDPDEKHRIGYLPRFFSDNLPAFRTKDKFDIVTRLAVLNDPDAARLLTELEKTETTDDAKRYAYAARAAFPTKENREKFWNDLTANKDISESWIEAAVGPFNSVRNNELSLPYLERALRELPNLKRSRKIFFVNNWLGAFIGGQRSEEALNIVNKFLADNPNLDKDLRLKILENVDIVERAVKIRAKYGKK